jgi:hypothetical protein
MGRRRFRPSCYFCSRLLPEQCRQLTFAENIDLVEHMVDRADYSSALVETVRLTGHGWELIWQRGFSMTLPYGVAGVLLNWTSRWKRCAPGSTWRSQRTPNRSRRCQPVSRFHPHARGRRGLLVRASTSRWSKSGRTAELGRFRRSPDRHRMTTGGSNDPVGWKLDLRARAHELRNVHTPRLSAHRSNSAHAIPFAIYKRPSDWM